MRSLSIPIDVMVLDMDWHETWTLTTKKDSPKDEFGQRVGWTGYTWQKKLFPNPSNCLQDLHNLGLKTTLNLHPASGIQPYEEERNQSFQIFAYARKGKADTLQYILLDLSSLAIGQPR